MPPVSERTFRHYGKLQRYGYSRYIPINQLDVKTLRDPFLDQTSRSREHPIQTASPVELRVLDGTRVRSFNGTSLELSTSEAVLRLRGRDTADFFDRLGSTSPFAEVVFKKTGEVRGGHLERLTLDVDQRLSTVRITFADSLDLRPLIEDANPDDEVVLRIVIGTPTAEPDLQAVARHLYWLSQAAEAARAAVTEISTEALGGERVDLRQAVIRDLRVGSIEIVAGLAFSTGTMLYLAMRGALNLRTSFWASEKDKQEALRLRWQNEQDGVKRHLDPAGLTTKVARLIRRDRGRGDGGELHLEAGEKIVQRQLMPTVEEIVELADGDVEIEMLNATPSQAEAIHAIEAGTEDELPDD